MSTSAHSQINPDLFSNVLLPYLAYHISPRSSKPATSTKSMRKRQHAQQANLLIHLTEAADINYFRARFPTGRHRRAYSPPAQLCWREPRESMSKLCKISTSQPALMGNHCTESVQLGQDLPTTWNDSWHSQCLLAFAPSGVWTLRRTAHTNTTLPSKAAAITGSEFFTRDGNAERLLPHRARHQLRCSLLSTTFAWCVDTPVQTDY